MEFPKNEIPVKIALIKNKLQDSLPDSNLIFASFANKEFIIFDGETLEINFSVILEN